MATSPFKIRIYSPQFEQQNGGGSGGSNSPVAILGDARAIDATLRWNGRGTVQIRLKGADVNNAAMLAADAYADVFYRGVRVLTGKVRTRQGSFGYGDRVYQIRDDTAVLDDILALPVPLNEFGRFPLLVPTSLTTTGANRGQWHGTVPNENLGDLTGAVGYYDWANTKPWLDAFGWTFSGLPNSTESAIRKLWIENFMRVERSVQGWTPGLSKVDLHRGKVITSAAQLPQIRMGKLSDFILPMATEAGLGVRVLRDLGEHKAGDVGDPNYYGNGIFWLEIYSPKEWMAPLTVKAGTIVEPSTWTLSDPTATRVMVGGPGELAQRHFSLVGAGLDGAWSAEEQRVAWVSETFRDATSAQLTWPDSLGDLYRSAAHYLIRPEVSASDKAILVNAMQAAGAAALAEGGASSGLSLTLAETPGFHFGGVDGIQLGDIVTAQDPTGAKFRDRLTEVAISYTSDGLTVTPKVGNRTDDKQRQLYDQIARLGTAQRKLSSNK